MRLVVHVRAEAPPEMLDGLMRVLADRDGLHELAAASALPLYQERLEAMGATDSTPFGAKSSGFWQRMQGGTVARHDADSARVEMPTPVALRAFGGTVTPKLAKYLAIPARTEAYGKSPREFDNLRPHKFRSGSLALVEADHSRLDDRKEYGGGVYFWLTESATIRANPDVLPSDDEVTGEVIDALAIYIEEEVA